MNRSTTTFLLFSFIVLLGCSANKDSFHRKGETVTLTLNKYPQENQPNTLAFSSITPFLVDFGIGKVKQILENEAGKFTGMYQAEISDSNFYTDASSKDRSMNYRSFVIDRKADLGKGPETVSKMEFKFNTDASRTFIAVQPVALKIDKSKAKLLQNDSTLDVIIDIRMVSFWIDINQEYRTAETANTSFVLSNIELGKAYDSNSKLLSKTSGWMFPIPLSVKPDGTFFGRGTFNLYCTVTEIDDYGKRIETIRNAFETNEAEIKDILLNSGKD
ncbi:hypothetical protein [Costertonia aggregata]|uniref:Uncharacterized protein n=1 Tax=Costertonia aggregata TaxID=343403 RepID=A0A7H9AUG3_9FLAO|nr:hypothetical protein [Costertonia aggregata]QLG47037.1 hypothetical protein HYG79_17305 [Costertonia aggregata]